MTESRGATLRAAGQAANRFLFLREGYLKMKNVLKLFCNKKGQGLVEYGILVGGIALVCLVAVAILGHKANDLLAITAAALPGAHADDNAPIVSGKLVNTTQDTNGVVYLDATTPGSIAGNLGIPGADALSVEADELAAP